jgi:hypothetical protein
LIRTAVRLRPRCPTERPDRVGKVARGQCIMSAAVAGDFAHPCYAARGRDALETRWPICAAPHARLRDGHPKILPQSLAGILLAE